MGARYLESHNFAALASTTQANYRIHLAGLVKSLGNRPTADITRSVAGAHLDKLPQGGHYKRGRLRVLKTLLNWAVDREVITANPLLGKTKPSAWGPMAGRFPMAFG